MVLRGLMRIFLGLLCLIVLGGFANNVLHWLLGGPMGVAMRAQAGAPLSFYFWTQGLFFLSLAVAPVFAVSGILRAKFSKKELFLETRFGTAASMAEIFFVGAVLLSGPKQDHLPGMPFLALCLVGATLVGDITWRLLKTVA